MKKIYILVICAFLYSIAPLHAGMIAELNDTVDVGIKPVIGLAFGKYFSRYSVPLGITAYARGFFQFRLDKRLRIYPEFKTGWFFTPHKTDSKQRIDFFPIQMNIFFDIAQLNFTYKWGDLKLRPYIGIGMTWVQYAGEQKNATGMDGGYQLGLNVEYTHPKMKGFYIEANIEHFLIAEPGAVYPAMIFTVGAGYSIPFRESINKRRGLYKQRTHKNREGRTGPEGGKLPGRLSPAEKKRYLRDLAGSDERKIIRAADILGHTREKAALVRLIELLLSGSRPAVRAHAAEALGSLGDRRALRPLGLAVIKDDSADVKLTALLSIYFLGPDSDVMKRIKSVPRDKKRPGVFKTIHRIDSLYRYSPVRKDKPAQ